MASTALAAPSDAADRFACPQVARGAQADRQARELFEQALAREAADPEGALVRLRCAETLAGKPVVPLRMGILFERLGRKGDAADAFERYLSLAGKQAPDAAQMRVRIARLRAPDKAPDPAPIVSSSPQPASSAARPLAGWITTGAGLALMLTGGVLLGSAKAKSDDVHDVTASSSTPWDGPEGREKMEEARREQTWGAILLGLGTVTAAAGGWMLVSPPRAPASRGAMIQYVARW